MSMSLAISLLLTAWLGGQAPAADGKPVNNTPPTAAEIAAAVERLGSKKYDEREAATELLWRAGRPALAALEAAANDRDLERAKRSQALLEKVRWGIRPDSPPEVLALIRRYRSEKEATKREVLSKLRDLKQFHVILELIRREPEGNFRRSVTTQFAGEFCKAAYDAWGDDDVPLAAELFREAESLATADVKFRRDFAAFLILTGRDDDVAVTALRRDAQMNPDGASARLYAELQLFRGEPATARAVADRTTDEALQREAAYRMRDWARLLELQPTDVEGPERLGLQLAYQRRAGDRTAAGETAQRLVESARADHKLIDDCGRRLLLNERPREAEQVLLLSPEETLEMRIEQLRYREALALFRPTAEPGWAAAWYRSEAEGKDLKKYEQRGHFRLALRGARFLYLLGLRDELEGLLKELAGDAAQGEGGQLWIQLFEAELLMGRRDSVEARAFDKLPVKEAGNILCGLAYKTRSDAARRWWRILKSHFAEETDPAVWARLKRVLSRGSGEPFTDVKLSELLKAGEAMIVSETGARDLHWQAMAEACVAWKHFDLAVECYERQIALIDESKRTSYLEEYLEPGAAAYLRIGDIWADLNDWRKAAAAYEAGWRRHRPHSLPLYLAGYALKKAGDVERGDEFMRRAERLPLADMEKYRLFSQGLQDRGLLDEAHRVRLQAMRFGVWTDWNYRLMSMVNAECGYLYERDPAAIAPHWDYLQLSIQHGGVTLKDFGDYCFTGQCRHKGLAWQAAAENRWDDAVRELSLAHEARPLHISFVESAVRKLESGGRRSEADAMYDATLQPYLDACREFPDAAWPHHAAAWLSVKCDRRLDDALRWAERSVELRPATASYHSLLAEIHFRRGDKTRAVELAEQAVKLAPTDAKIAAQLKKFQAAGKQP